VQQVQNRVLLVIEQIAVELVKMCFILKKLCSEVFFEKIL
jgi:hypothetical protein